MKKVLIFLVFGLFLFTGCGNAAMNTPTSKVESYLGKYQKLDNKVLADLDDVLDKEKSMSESQRKEYKDLLENKIKNEEINGDNATVDVEIEVLDYQTSIEKSKEYYNAHSDEFTKDKKENDENNDNKDNEADKIKDDVKETSEDIGEKVEETIDEVSSFIDYKLKELKGVKTTIKHDITFNLTKKDGVWTIEDLDESDRKKLHGLY